MVTPMKTYSELIQLATFEERFLYLKLDGHVGAVTFGYDREFNQRFYKSNEWKSVRNHVIVRDAGCDLAVEGREIPYRAIVHHMNPILLRDVMYHTDALLNPEYLVCLTHETHNAIHYGDESILKRTSLTMRKQNDTCPWRK